MLVALSHAAMHWMIGRLRVEPAIPWSALVGRAVAVHGKLGNLLGRKWLFVAALTLFLAGSVFIFSSVAGRVTLRRTSHRLYRSFGGDHHRRRDHGRALHS